MFVWNPGACVFFVFIILQTTTGPLITKKRFRELGSEHLGRSCTIHSLGQEAKTRYQTKANLIAGWHEDFCYEHVLDDSSDVEAAVEPFVRSRVDECKKAAAEEKKARQAEIRKRAKERAAKKKKKEATRETVTKTPSVWDSDVEDDALENDFDVNETMARGARSRTSATATDPQLAALKMELETMKMLLHAQSSQTSRKRKRNHIDCASEEESEEEEEEQGEKRRKKAKAKKRKKEVERRSVAKRKRKQRRSIAESSSDGSSGSESCESSGSEVHRKKPYKKKKMSAHSRLKALELLDKQRAIHQELALRQELY